VGPTDSIHPSNGEADGNDTKHMKNYDIWHRAQICIFYGIEHMSYIFLWHIGNFIKKNGGYTEYLGDLPVIVIKAYISFLKGYPALLARE
jgi:hypothetical protein